MIWQLRIGGFFFYCCTKKSPLTLIIAHEHTAENFELSPGLAIDPKDRNTGTGVFLINPDRITDLEDCARPLTIWRDHSPEQLFVADASSAVCLRPDPIPDADGDCLKFPGDCLKFLVEFAKVSDYADDEIMPGFVIGREVSRVGLEI